MDGESITTDNPNELSLGLEWLQTAPFHFGDLRGPAALRGCYNIESSSNILRRMNNKIV